MEKSETKFEVVEVRWCEGMKSTWKSKVVRTEAALDKLLAKLDDKGATDVAIRVAS